MPSFVEILNLKCSISFIKTTAGQQVANDYFLNKSKWVEEQRLEGEAKVSIQKFMEVIA